MRIIDTTDHKFIGMTIRNLSKGQSCMLDDFKFLVVRKKELSDRTIFSNSNYVIIATKD